MFLSKNDRKAQGETRAPIARNKKNTHINILYSIRGIT